MLRLLAVALVLAACDASQLLQTVQFKGLVASFSGDIAYDNTTCEGRCCNKVEVRRGSGECDRDWTQCATRKSDSVLLQCNSTLTTGCSAWVPCDLNTRVSFYVPWGVLFGFSLVLLLVLCTLSCGKDTPAGVTSMAMFLTVKLILLSFLLVPVSDYRYWTSHTETSSEFVVYQECAAYCNRVTSTWPTDFCGSSKEGSTDFCYTKRDEWKIYNQAVTYLEVRAYVEWMVILFLGLLRYLLRFQFNCFQDDFMFTLFRWALWCYAFSHLLLLGLDAYASANIKHNVQLLADVAGYRLSFVVDLLALFIVLAMSDFLLVFPMCILSNSLAIDSFASKEPFSLRNFIRGLTRLHAEVPQTAVQYNVLSHVNQHELIRSWAEQKKHQFEVKGIQLY